MEKYRKYAQNTRDQGDKFEKLMQAFLKTYPPYLSKLTEVWLWKEFPFKRDFGGKDIGIDLVAKTVDGDYWAVQCKFYRKKATIDKSAVDSFVTAAGIPFRDETEKLHKFIDLLWIATNEHWNSAAENVARSHDPQITRLFLSDLRNANH